MGLILPIILVFLTILEIVVFMEVGGHLGLFYTITLTILTTFSGTILLKKQGLHILFKAQESFSQNKFPIEQIFDGLCIIIAGLLLLIPGFVTDVLGFLVFFPPFRLPLKTLGVCLIKTKINTSSFRNKIYNSTDGKTLDGEFCDITEQENPSLSRFVIDNNNKDKFNRP